MMISPTMKLHCQGQVVEKGEVGGSKTSGTKRTMEMKWQSHRTTYIHTNKNNNG